MISMVNGQAKLLGIVVVAVVGVSATGNERNFFVARGEGVGETVVGGVMMLSLLCFMLLQELEGTDGWARASKGGGVRERLRCVCCDSVAMLWEAAVGLLLRQRRLDFMISRMV